MHHTTYGKALPAYEHTSQDGSRNQPIRKEELAAFSKENPLFILRTNPKPNRAARRKKAKK